MRVSLRRNPLSPTRLAGAAAAAVVLSVTLTACGDVAEKAAEEAAEKAIEEGAEGNGEGVDVELGEEGEFSVEGENGDEFSVGNELPDDYPVDEVPLIEGEIVSATTSTEGGQGGWIVVLSTDAAAEDAFADADGQLLGAGFQHDGEPIESLAAYTGAAYTVQLLTADNGDGTTSVQYYVSTIA